MTHKRFWQQLGARLQELFGWEASGSDREDRFDRLFRELRQATAALAQARQQLQALRRRLSELEPEVDLLAERARVYCRLGDADNAWQLALKLDSQRQAVQETRAQVQAQQQLCSLHQLRVNQLKHGLADLQAGQPEGGPPPWQDDTRSGPLSSMRSVR
jgi:hypothetical protein